MAFDPEKGLLPARYNRRQLILGSSAAAMVAVALAACGSDKKTTAPATEAPTTTASTSGSEAPATTEAATATTEAAVATTAPAGGPKAGGILRVGQKGGAKDLIDGQHIVGKSDIMRQVTGWEPLMSFSDKFVPEYTNGLAQSVTANDTIDVYTIKLKDGVKFGNGNPVTADDMVYSFTRMLDKTLALYGGSALRLVLDVSGIKKIDDQTVELHLLQPVSNFKENLCAYTCAIVPQGYERFSGDPTNQVGTGPYMLKAFEPGKQSTHVKNTFYWDTGKPYFDEVHIIDFADDDAMINALLADQIDVCADILSASVATVQGADGYKVLNSAGGGWLTISMAVDQEPFTDVRVRQAMRLIVDRDAMVEQVLSGFGRVANDLYSPLDAAYAKDLPQRKQDLEAAKKLLADAGKSDLTIDLFAPNDTAALGDMITLFAEQAKGAGVTVNAQIIDQAVYWGSEYLKRTFATDYWGTRNFLPQVAASSLKDTAPYPDDHWPPAGSTFEADYKAAVAEPDDAKRKVITDRMQKDLYDNGGLIIPFFQNLLDAYNGKVQGLVERSNTLNLDHYGRGWKNLYFSA
jgi:peptide/nickel transport system substrate-binding protein